MILTIHLEVGFDKEDHPEEVAKFMAANIMNFTLNRDSIDSLTIRPLRLEHDNGNATTDVEDLCKAVDSLTNDATT